MMTPNQLDRSSQAYQRGYRAGYASELEMEQPLPPDNGTFRERDYADGFAAGRNDRRWDKK